MVRILSCHHFRGQRIGRCDEAVGVAVAGNAVIVALEHQVNVYGKVDHNLVTSSTSWSSDASSPSAGFGSYSFGHAFADNRIYDLGTPFSYHVPPATPGHAVGALNQFGRPRTTSGSSSVDSVDSDTELRLSHNFSTIDYIENVSYNEAGRYILCLEKRETSAHSNTTSVRAYFNWEKSHSKPMKARIAGLVSPTGAKHEEDSLTMVEIPLTSPATAVTSCNLSGHLATLSAESILTIFLFRAKEASGRVKVHYFDFDRVYSIEMPGFVPEKISFLTDYIACMNPHEVRVFRVKKENASYLKDSPVSPVVIPASRSKPPPVASFFTDSKITSDAKGFKSLPIAPGNNVGKVVFDPKNETVKVHLSSIVRANRRRKCPSALISEEYQDEIHVHKTKVVFSAIHPGIIVDDVMRVHMSGVPGSTSTSSNSRFLQVEMYPVRVKEHLGGIALLIASVKEGFLYHLPSKKDSTQAIRVTTYPLTAPLLSFTFDSLFFHALTETGLESYTSRCLYYALKETEGFQMLKNDCPLQDESPCLVGIRPFLRVRHIVCNDRSLCLLACSHQAASSGKKLSSSLSNEENMWTIYTLDLPDIDMIYEDVMRTANLQADTNREAYFTLLCEAHTLLRLYVNAHPASEFAFSNKLKETCKLIGLEYFKSSWINPLAVPETLGSTSPVPVASPNSSNPQPPTTRNASPPVQFDLSVSEHSALNISEDVLDKGVTYFVMAKCDLQEIFSQENSSWVKDPHLIPGIVKLIDTILSDLPVANSDNVDNHKIPPALAPSLVDFLAAHGSKVLIDLVIRSPVFRECNTRRLIHVLSHLTENRRYQSKVTLALILALVTIGGVDEQTCHQINEILQKTNVRELEAIIPQEALFEVRGKQVSLTDLAVSLAHSEHSQLLIDIVVGLLKRHLLTVSEFMLAFAQAVNLNSDTHLQHCITKCLTSILETYLSGKLKSETQNTQGQPSQVSSLAVNSAGFANSTNLHFTDEEKRAVQTLVRTYLSNFSLALSHNPTTNDNTASDHGAGSSSPKAQHHFTDTVKHTQTKSQDHKGTASDKKVPGSNDHIAKSCCFGSIPSFVNYLLSLNTPGGNISPQSQNVATSPLLTSEESRDNFTKLLSLLSSELANFDGVRDLILTYLYKSHTHKPRLDPALFVILQVLSEPADKAVAILLTKQPTTVLLYAKEIFGRKTVSWKVLVTQLKKNVQIKSDSVEGDMYATILESVYLHLANTLTPTELEQVLDKETDESTKFHSICKRVELANTYANMVITVSTEYLKQN